MNRSDIADSQPVLFFDGVCNLCNGMVQFVIRHDKKEIIRFAPLQGKAAAGIVPEVIKKYGYLPDSLILKVGPAYAIKSSAALQVLKILGGWWKFLYWLGMIFPAFLRNGVYRVIAQNRYKWFGKKQSCMIPTPDLKARFLD
jgi:predicted DCC family thiol-disulfide oxidoreductase YuxK